MINSKLNQWIIIACLTWTAGYLFNRYHEPEVQWIKSLYEEKIELAKSTQAPKRVLIVGGSGTHFGIDALEIERELNIPVFNLGLHAGLGLNAILASVSNEIRSGDIVLLIFEYDLMTNDGTGYYSSSFGAAIDRPGIGGVGSKQVAREIMLMGVPSLDRIAQFIKRSQISLSSERVDDRSSNRKNSYSNNKIDKRGSPVYLPDGNPYPANIKNNISEYTLMQLQTFHQEVEEAGATTILGLPWVLVETDEEHLETVRGIAKELAEIAPVVYDDRFNLKINSTLFGDTNYHLSPQGRKLRSSALIQQLEDKLQL